MATGRRGMRTGAGERGGVVGAILLGILQGPTEMAPISSSAHTSLARAAMRFEQGPSESKALDVALHGGSALSLGVALRGELRRSWSRLANGEAAGEGLLSRNGDRPLGDDGERQIGGIGAGRRKLAILALSLAPPSAAGYMFERSIEQRLSGRRANAMGLAIGAAAMAVADASPAGRSLEQADALDGLALGIAQAAALIPGVSRRGATLTAARLRGMSRQDADELSWLTALPVILGACALKAARLYEAGTAQDEDRGRARAASSAPQLLAGAGASFAATLASARLLGGMGRVRLLWFAAYRLALAILAVRSMGDNAR